MGKEENTLLVLLKKDQDIIDRYKRGEASREEFSDQSEKITAEFIHWIKHNGFPYKNKTNENIYEAAIVLALHAGLPNLEYIWNMIRSADFDQVAPEHRAYIIDKMCVLRGQRQVYGTQYKETEKGVEFFPIKDERHLNERRKEVGLAPVGKYKAEKTEYPYHDQNNTKGK